MPNFKIHIAAGIYTYPLYLLAFYLISELVKISPDIDPVTITFGFLLYVLGSDLPDIDAGESLARRIAEVLITVIVASAIFAEILLKYVYTVLAEIVPFQFISIPLLFFVSILAGTLISKLLKLFKHRGFLHSIWATLIYGGIVFGTAFSIRSYSLKDSLFLSLAAFFGYNLHRFLDMVMKGG